MKTLFIIIIVPVFFINACSNNKDPELTNEIVMSAGMHIKAKNASGTITIETGKDLERLYAWDDSSVKVKMQRRDKRWDGSLGIYNPGGGNKVHTVVEEGQQHFYSEAEAIEWLCWQDDRLHYVYSDDGLVVGWYKTINSISGQVWQFYILGHKPNKLPGARNELVKVTFDRGGGAQQIKIGTFQPSSPQMINGRWFSGKSFDIMKEKGITADRVEKAVSEGKKEQQGKYLYYYYFNHNELLWLLLDKHNRVVLLGN
jgi:hypothetical protein